MQYALIARRIYSSCGSVFVSGQPSASQVSRPRIPFRAPDRFVLEVSCSIISTSSSICVELELKYMVPRLNMSVSCSMLYYAR